VTVKESAECNNQRRRTLKESSEEKIVSFKKNETTASLNMRAMKQPSKDNKETAKQR
jgi:hypothetical protein